MEFMMTFKIQLLNKNHPHIKKLFWLEKNHCPYDDISHMDKLAFTGAAIIFTYMIYSFYADFEILFAFKFLIKMCFFMPIFIYLLMAGINEYHRNAYLKEQQQNQDLFHSENFTFYSINWTGILKEYQNGTLTEEICRKKYIAFHFNYDKLIEELKSLDYSFKQHLKYKVKKSSEIHLICQIDKSFKETSDLKKYIKEYNQILSAIECSQDPYSANQFVEDKFKNFILNPPNLERLFEKLSEKLSSNY